ncbi:hypothetical protein PISMIDRAFT_684048, partial [Pisolithus microcarpus 441]
MRKDSLWTPSNSKLWLSLYVACLSKFAGVLGVAIVPFLLLCSDPAILRRHSSYRKCYYIHISNRMLQSGKMFGGCQIVRHLKIQTRLVEYESEKVVN